MTTGRESLYHDRPMGGSIQPLTPVATAGNDAHVLDGATERAAFFGPGIFGISHLPPGRATGGLVICSPVFAEFRRNYRREVGLARSLAAHGVAVQRFHYRGTGNSAGKGSDTTLATMQADGLAAARWLRQQAGDLRLAFMGTRLGALAAAGAAARLPGAPLALWEPVIEQGPYLRDAFMAKVIRDLKEGRSGSRSVEELLEDLRRDGEMDVLGYSVDWPLLGSIQEHSLPQEVGPDPRPLLLVQIGGSELRSQFRALVTRWETGGFPVDTEVVPWQEAWWFERGARQEESGTLISETLISATQAWVERRTGGGLAGFGRPTDPAEAAALNDRPDIRPREVAVFFPAGDEVLFGIITEPTTGAKGIGVVLLQGSSYHNVSSHRNRLAVRLAGRLAAQGFHAFRFDYHGVGDSTGVAGEFRLANPFLEDLQGAVGCLAARGISRYVFVGHCFGARTALALAGDVSGTVGVALGALSLADLEPGEEVALRLADSLGVRDYLRRALRVRTIRTLIDPAQRATYARFARAKLRTLATRLTRHFRPARSQDPPWLDPLVLDLLEGLPQHGIPILMAYGNEDMSYRGFRDAQAGRLGRILRRYRRLVEVRVVEGNLHAFPSVGSQDAFIQATMRWIGDQLDGSGGGGAPG